MVHDTGQWPLIDEYGMNINPSSYTEVAITEVSIDVIQYTRDILNNQINWTQNLIIILYSRQSYSVKSILIHLIALNPGKEQIFMI